MQSLIFFLDNIRSAHNVGSILRTAECFGVDEVILGGVTPAPVDRFGRANEKVCKVSLGAEQLVTWRSVSGNDDVTELLNQYKREGYVISALEQSNRSTLLHDVQHVEKRILILGEETKGVDPTMLAIVDEIIEIPQRGAKESLNVSVATGIAVYHLTMLPRTQK
jgi:23S rRNA (guanosine2251-2'-O)-methyltransferase